MQQETAGKPFEKMLKPGEVLFKEGDPAADMYLIRSGKIKISKTGGGVEQTLATLRDGDFFGEMAVIDGSPRSATASAVEQSTLLIMDRKGFTAQIERNPFIRYVLETLTRRLRETNRQIEFLLIRNEERRLVAYLLSKAKQEGKAADGGIRMPFSYTAKDLANMAGMEAGKAQQLFDKLLASKLMSLEQDVLTIPSVGDLEEYLRYITLKERFEEGR